MVDIIFGDEPYGTDIVPLTAGTATGAVTATQASHTMLATGLLGGVPGALGTLGTSQQSQSLTAAGFVFTVGGGVGGPGAADYLKAHLGKDLLLIAEPYEGSIITTTIDSEMFPPFGELADFSLSTQTTLTRQTIYIAATTGRSTANNDIPPAQYVPGRLRNFNFGARLFEGTDPLLRPSANEGLIALIDPDGTLNNLINRVWDGTPLILKRGPRGDYKTSLFKDWGIIGRYRGAGLVRDLDEKQFRLRDNAWPLSGVLHGETYTGAGGVEGTADIKGRLKPWAIGHNFDIEPVLLSGPDQIFQWSLSSSQAMNEFRHGGVPITIAANYASYSALQAATIPSGQCATCLAQSLVRPNLTLQFGVRVDVVGDANTFNGHTTPLTRADIVRRIATVRGLNVLDDTTEIDAASFAAMNTAHPAPVGWYFDGSPITKAAAIDKVLAGILGWWYVKPSGQLTIGWLRDPATLTPTVIVDCPTNDVGKPRLIATDPPRRGTRITWRWNYAPFPDRSGLAGSVTDANAALYMRQTSYAQDISPVLSTIWPTAPLVTIDEAGFRDEADAVAEATRQQVIYSVVRSRWGRDLQFDPFADFMGAAFRFDNDPLLADGSSVQLCVAIEAVGSSINMFEFFT